MDVEKKENLVSVLIPCFNAERWIAGTLSSVLAQTNCDLEIIVVDDGSTDGSVRIIENFISERIQLIQQTNAGASGARNNALTRAKGAFIQFIDADDLLAPDKIERQLQRILNRPGAIAMAEWARFTRSPEEAIFLPDPTWRDQAPMDWLVAAWEQGGGMLFPAMWLIPRDIIEKAGPWDESLTLNDDGEYFTRIVLASNEVLFCGGARSYYRSSIPGSLSGLKSSAGWQSHFHSIECCADQVLRREDSERVRRCVSMLWQRFAHASYPYRDDLAEDAIGRAQVLHSEVLLPEGGRIFKLASEVLGWRAARRLQQRYYDWK